MSGRGRIIASTEGTNLVGGSGKKILKFGGSETLFSILHGICLRKIDLEYENSKQLQVTIIIITKSKENKSIHRLNVSGSGGAAAPPPPLATALETCGNINSKLILHKFKLLRTYTGVKKEDFFEVEEEEELF